MAVASEIAIDLSRRRLRAVHAGWVRGRLQVKRTISEPLPADLDDQDPQAVGRWLAAAMKRAGMNGEHAVFALSREHVALKRLTLPTTNAVELPDMTRLAMQRELPFDPETAVIDYLSVRQTESETTVLAVAVPQPVLKHTSKLAKAAGLKIDRISLRGMGAAGLIESKSSGSVEAAQRTLLLDVANGTIDFSVIEDGAIRFSRAADITPLEEDGADGDAIIREIRRTWMSYRIVDEDSRVDEALLIGDEHLPADAVQSVGEMLQVRTRRLDAHARVEVNGSTMDGLWPLAGLLLGSNLRQESIDFAHPRQAPDVGARKRQVALGLVGLIIILAYGGWTMARRSLVPLEDRYEQTRSLSVDLAPRYKRYGRDKYKLEHLQNWESSRIDWLGHAQALLGLMPAPGSNTVVLDEFTGTLNFRGVDFDLKTNRWSADKEIVIVLDGEAADRRVADAFRAALVSSKLYQTSSSGTDAEGGKRLPFGFTYKLSTTTARPGETREDSKEADGESVTTVRRDAGRPGEPGEAGE